MWEVCKPPGYGLLTGPCACNVQSQQAVVSLPCLSMGCPIFYSLCPITSTILFHSEKTELGGTVVEWGGEAVDTDAPTLPTTVAICDPTWAK